MKRNFTVLMAEDNDHDVLATKRSWKQYNIRNDLRIVRDGEECIDYLLKRNAYQNPEDAPSPGVILLDIKMPKLDGLEVLKFIKSHKELRKIPVVILTTSKAEEDRIASYDFGANAFIQKPVGFLNFAEAIKQINVFWELVELPEMD